MLIEKLPTGLDVSPTFDEFVDILNASKQFLATKLSPGNVRERVTFLMRMMCVIALELVFYNEIGFFDGEEVNIFVTFTD